MSLSVEKTIEALTNKDGFAWGINTVMGILRPGCLYQLEAKAGVFTITHWEENQWSEEKQCYLEPPTPMEIRDEYIRQQTIAECIEYFKEKQFFSFK